MRFVRSAETTMLSHLICDQHVPNKRSDQRIG